MPGRLGSGVVVGPILIIGSVYEQPSRLQPLTEGAKVCSQVQSAIPQAPPGARCSRSSSGDAPFVRAACPFGGCGRPRRHTHAWASRPARVQPTPLKLGVGERSPGWRRCWREQDWPPHVLAAEPPEHVSNFCGNHTGLSAKVASRAGFLSPTF